MTSEEVLVVAKMLGLEDFLPLAQTFKGFNDVELIESDFPFVQNREETEKLWKKHLELFPDDFDGSLGSVVSFSFSGKKLIIKYRKAKFSEYCVTQRPKTLDINDCFNYCLPLSFGAVATTKPTRDSEEGYIIFAERGNTAFDNGRITTLPGGYFDPEQDCNFKNIILRECLEELHTRPSKIEFMGVIYNREGSRQPLVAVHLKLPFTAEQMEEVINNREREKEIGRLFFVENNAFAVHDFLAEEARQGKTLAIHDAWKLILYFSDTYN